MVQELEIEEILNAITMILIERSDSTSNIGLFDGKMGIAIFLFLYARYTTNRHHEEWAEKLIDEIFTQIDTDTQPDFSNGLAGIGWGIEYLVKNNFVDADVDEVLGDVDRIVLSKTKDLPALIQNNTDLYGYVFYSLTRLKDKDSGSDSILSLIKKQMLIYIHDDIERLLTKKVLFDFTVPTLTMHQINPIMYFFIEMGKLKLYPAKLKKLENYLPHYLNEKSYLNYDFVDEYIFSSLKEKFVQVSTTNEVKELYKNLLNNSTSILQIDDVMNMYAKPGWNSLLYQINYFDNMNYRPIKDEILSKLANKSHNGNFIDIENNCLIGIGLTLLLENTFIKSK
jgi:hypothetical protein